MGFHIAKCISSLPETPTIHITSVTAQFE